MVFLVTVVWTESGSQKYAVSKSGYESDFMNDTIEAITEPFHWRFP